VLHVAAPVLSYQDASWPGTTALKDAPSPAAVRRSIAEARGAALLPMPMVVIAVASDMAGARGGIFPC